jgi:membrane protein YqaA with SNARE-associated domain
MVGIYKAVPAGFLLKASPILICFMTALGASTSVILIYFFGNWIKIRILEKGNQNRLNKKKSRAKVLFERYGIIGLAILGTVSIGPYITVLMGLIIVNEQKKLLLWTIISILFWTSSLTVVANISIELLNKFTVINLFTH